MSLVERLSTVPAMQAIASPNNGTFKHDRRTVRIFSTATFAALVLVAQAANAEPRLENAQPVPANAEVTTQAAEPRPANAEAKPEPEAPLPSSPAERAKKIAQLLNPRDYPPAFLLGSQAELVGPVIGVTPIVFGYDAIWGQAEASVGMFAGDDVVTGTKATNSYKALVRLFYPVHSGIRADFSLLLGGGVIFLKPPATEERTIGTVVAGARYRLFMSPNIATFATLGVGVAFSNGTASVAAGARPLGAAGVAYFFR